MPRKLGYFLLGVTIFQVVLYISAAWLKNSAEWLFYFDPRIGLFFVQSAVGQESFPGVLSWVSVALLFGIAVAIIRDASWLPIYLILEAVLAIPSLLMFVIIVAANLSAAHGFSVGELPVPAVVFLAASGAPFIYAFILWRRLANKPLQPTSGFGRSN